MIKNSPCYRGPAVLSTYLWLWGPDQNQNRAATAPASEAFCAWGHAAHPAAAQRRHLAVAGETPSPSPRPWPQPPGAAMAPPARCWGDAKGAGLRWPPGVRRHAPGPASAAAAAPSFAASMADRSLVHTKRVNVAPAMHSTTCKCHSDGGGSASSWGTRPAGRSGWGDAPCTPCGSVQPPCPTEPSAPFRWQHKSWQRKEKKNTEMAPGWGKDRQNVEEAAPVSLLCPSNLSLSQRGLWRHLKKTTNPSQSCPKIGCQVLSQGLSSATAPLANSSPGGGQGSQGQQAWASPSLQLSSAARTTTVQRARGCLFGLHSLR